MNTLIRNYEIKYDIELLSAIKNKSMYTKYR